MKFCDGLLYVNVSLSRFALKCRLFGSEPKSLLDMKTTCSCTVDVVEGRLSNLGVF